MSVENDVFHLKAGHVVEALVLDRQLIDPMFLGMIRSAIFRGLGGGCVEPDREAVNLEVAVRRAQAAGGSGEEKEAKEQVETGLHRVGMKGAPNRRSVPGR